MYLIETVQKTVMGEGSFFLQSAKMFGISMDYINQCDKCEIWGTSFKDDGADYCEYRFFKDDKPIGQQRVSGY